MNLTSIATSLMFCLSCIVVYGQNPFDDTSAADSADSYLPPLPEVISRQPDQSLIDMAKPTPSWEATPPSTTQVTTPSVMQTPQSSMPPSSFVPFESVRPLSQLGWFVRAETMFLKLSHGPNEPLVYELVQSAPSKATQEIGPVITTNTISNNSFEAVPRVTFGYRFDDEFVVEFTYLGRNDWSKSASASASPSVFAVASPDSLLAVNAWTSLASSMHSVEMNLVQPFETRENIGFLFGLRYFRFDEQLRFRTESDIGQNTYLSNYDIQTTNNLYGAQIGIRWGIERNRWSLTGTGKTGAYVNDASQQQSLGYSSNLNQLPGRDITASRHALSTIQEFGINGVYRITERLSIRAGYNLFIIRTLARASEQIDFSSNLTPSFSTHGTAVLHGPSAGIEFRY